jgi:hypothetical protein
LVPDAPCYREDKRTTLSTVKVLCVQGENGIYMGQG